MSGRTQATSTYQAEDYPRLGARCPSGQECHKANEKWEESESRAGAGRSDQRAAKLRARKDGEDRRDTDTMSNRTSAGTSSPFYP